MRASILLLSALAVPAGASAQDDRPILAGATPAPAADVTRVRATATAYVELDQGVIAALNRDDTVTYAQVAAGLDAAIATKRVQGQASFRYERRIPESGRFEDADIATGLARVAYHVARALTLEAGAIGTRTRVDIRGAAPAITDTADVSNVAELYSFYAGPTLSTYAGPVQIGASYRFGYTKAEAPGPVALAAGSPRLDYFDQSIGHEANVSAGVAPGRVLPFGITLSGGYARESADQLSQRYEDWFGRSDILLPVTRTLALTAGVGYQHIKISQKDAVVNAHGVPVTDRNGRLVTDDASPRRIAYNTDGLIYDAGVVWRPSPRTALTATVAHQYDSTSYTGQFDWRIDRTLALHADAYDGIETFGHQLRLGLQGLPTSFVTQAGSYGQQFNGCVFGGGGTGGAGNCLNDVLQSITTASYRARGVDAVLSATRGFNRFGIGAGYSSRRLFSAATAPGLVLLGVDNDSYYVQALYSRRIDRRSEFDANVFANYYTSGIAGLNGTAGDVLGAGATGAYTRTFGRLGATAQLGLYYFDQQRYFDQFSAQALVGARYQF